MHVLSRKRLREAVQKHRDLEAPLDTWYRIAKKAEWQASPMSVRPGQPQIPWDDTPYST